MKVLVTGASGFIGRNLVPRLIERGDDVVCLARKPIEGLPPNVRFHTGDITRADSLSGLLKQSFDRLYHVAGLVSFGPADRKALFDVNETGTKHILDLAQKIGVARSVHVSSCSTIGPKEDNSVADETAPFRWNPEEQPYGASKFAGEQAARSFAEKGLPVAIVNPAFVFGEGDTHTPAAMLLRKIKQRAVPIYPPGGACFVWVGDVVRGIVAAGEKGRSGERYILGGENVKHGTAYRFIAKAVGGIPPVTSLPTPVFYVYGVLAEIEAKLRRRPPRFTRSWARLMNHCHYFSSAKAQRELGYTFLPFEEMIRRTAAWLTDHSLL